MPVIFGMLAEVPDAKRKTGEYEHDCRSGGDPENGGAKIDHSARWVWNVLLSRRRDRGSRRGQRHVVRVPHHGRRLTAVKAGHACRADQTLDRTRVVQDHLRVASCLPVRVTTQPFDGPVRHGHARPPASRSSALRFKRRGPARPARATGPAARRTGRASRG